MSKHPTPSSERSLAVDAVKALAMLGIIVVHTHPFHRPAGPGAVAEPETLYILFNQLARFAVPFFFVISGYYFGVRVRTGASPILRATRMTRHFLLLVLLWSIIYLLPFRWDLWQEYGWGAISRESRIHLHYMVHHPINTFLQGTRSHLWFLVAEMFAAVLVSVCVRARLRWALYGGAVSLYVLGLLAKAYVDTPLGIPVHLNTRNGPFFSTLFFAAGYVLSAFPPQRTWWRTGWRLLVAGYALTFLELSALHRLYGTSWIQDFVLGTVPLGLGTAMVALSDAPCLRNPVLAAVGRNSLGIYLGHVIFLDLFAGLPVPVPSVVWDIAEPVLILIFSLLLTRVLHKSRVTRVLVS